MTNYNILIRLSRIKRNHTVMTFWQRLTNQICKCNHEKWWHIPRFDKTRSDVQCGQFIFEGGAFGEHGSLHCCQCLSYHQKELPFGYWFYKLKKAVRNMIIKPEPYDEVKYAKSHYCVCGHSAFDHDIGNPEKIIIDPMYPPCNICKCPEYDYVNNPKIATNKDAQRLRT